MSVDRDPVRVLLVRHGEQRTDDRDPSLSDRGLAQAAAVASAIDLTDNDRLLSSTLRRAVETARATGREPEQLRDLDEFRFGPSWTWEQGEEREDLALWRPEHSAGEESLLEFQTRVESALDALVSQPPPGRLVVVVHSGVMDAVVRWAFGIAPDVAWTTEVGVPHGSVTELQHWPEGRHPHGAPRHTFVARLGEVRHLPPELVTGL